MNEVYVLYIPNTAFSKKKKKRELCDWLNRTPHCPLLQPGTDSKAPQQPFVPMCLLLCSLVPVHGQSAKSGLPQHKILRLGKSLKRRQGCICFLLHHCTEPIILNTGRFLAGEDRKLAISTISASAPSLSNHKLGRVLDIAVLLKYNIVLKREVSRMQSVVYKCINHQKGWRDLQICW